MAANKGARAYNQLLVIDYVTLKQPEWGSQRSLAWKESINLADMGTEGLVACTESFETITLGLSCYRLHLGRLIKARVDQQTMTWKTNGLVLEAVDAESYTIMRKEIDAMVQTITRSTDWRITWEARVHEMEPSMRRYALRKVNTVLAGAQDFISANIN